MNRDSSCCNRMTRSLSQRAIHDGIAGICPLTFGEISTLGKANSGCPVESGSGSVTSRASRRNRSPRSRRLASVVHRGSNIGGRQGTAMSHVVTQADLTLRALYLDSSTSLGSSVRAIEDVTFDTLRRSWSVCQGVPMTDGGRVSGARLLWQHLRSGDDDGPALRVVETSVHGLGRSTKSLP